jgi:hypothetical protein
MTTKPRESISSVEKQGAHQSIPGETIQRVSQSHIPHIPLTDDEIRLLSRKAFLKFDVLLVLPILTILREC